MQTDDLIFLIKLQRINVQYFSYIVYCTLDKIILLYYGNVFQRGIVFSSLIRQNLEQFLLFRQRITRNIAALS